MDAQPRVSPLTNRKVVRRGLLAGLAGLGAAAMLKVTGAGRAEAVDGQFILIGDEAQTAQTETRLTANPAFDGIVLQVLNGGPSLTGVYRSAIAGSGGGTKAGVTGLSQSSVGVYGESSTYHAVEGVSGSHLGVRGISASSSQAGIQERTRTAPRRACAVSAITTGRASRVSATP
jgi:hypothetical protein